MIWKVAIGRNGMEALRRSKNTMPAIGLSIRVNSERQLRELNVQGMVFKY
ncbi:hypothetical protein ACFLTQ_01215 [Chloroflexota bacterium]